MAILSILYFLLIAFIMLGTAYRSISYKKGKVDFSDKLLVIVGLIGLLLGMLETNKMFC